MDDLKTLRATVAAVRAAPQGDRLRAACAVVGVPIGQVRDTTRPPHKIAARRMVTLALYVGTELGWLQIAALMQRDHATCMHHARKLAGMLGWDYEGDLRDWWTGLQAADAVEALTFVQHQKRPLRIVA